MDKFATWWRAFEVRSLVSTITSKAETVRKAQLNRTLKKLRSLSDEEQEYLNAMTKSIVNKILKDPLSYLKANGHNSHADVVRELFRLDEEK